MYLHTKHLCSEYFDTLFSNIFMQVTKNMITPLFYLKVCICKHIDCLDNECLDYRNIFKIFIFCQSSWLFIVLLVGYLLLMTCLIAVALQLIVHAQEYSIKYLH